MWSHMLIALDAVRANKLRSALTALGIFIGVFTVIVMIGLIAGVNHSVEGVINEELGTDTFWIGKVFEPNHNREERRKLWRERKDIDPRDVDALNECDLVKTAAPYLGLYKPMYRGDEKTKRVEIIGTTQTYLDAIHLDVAEGRGWTDLEAERGRQVVVIGRTIARRLFPEGDYLGKEVRIEAQPFRVIGVLNERGKKLGNDLDAKALIPSQAALKLFGHGLDSWIIVQAASPRVIQEAQDQVIQVMRLQRGVPASKENDFDVVLPDKFTEMFKKTTAATAAGLTGIAFIALLVGGIGIMNIMLVSVTERTKEIGVRKAIGAKRHEILRQFLVESVVLTSLGGIVALIVSSGVVWLIAKVTPVPALVPPWAPFAGLGLCCVVGIGFGVVPAVKAARLDPIECIRYE